MVDNVALGPVFLPVLRFYPVNILPPMLHTHLRLQAALTRTIGGKPESLRTVMLFRKSWSIGKKSTFTFLSSNWSYHGLGG